MELVHVITDTSVMVMDATNGRTVTFFSDDPRYIEATSLIKEGNVISVFKLDTKSKIESFIEDSDDYAISISIEDGIGVIILHEFNDMRVELQSAITDRIIKMSSQGFDTYPLTNFISNLYRNPSPTAISELYMFLNSCELPITDDGCFIAYKMVKYDYCDIYSGTIINTVGEVVSMPRSMVDDNRDNTCSKGLHFCSKDYLPYYGQTQGTRCMLVKIDPADVVSIPSDYNNAKGRTWRYEVVGEVADMWRDKLKDADYTNSAVVSPNRFVIDECDDSNECDESGVLAFEEGYADGYKDGKNKIPFIPASNMSNYDRGYDIGYKDGRNKRKKQYN